MSSKFRQIKATKITASLKNQQSCLKNEASKIQSKLEQLKAEVAMRKTIKNSTQVASKQESLKSTQKSSTGQQWIQQTKPTIKSVGKKISPDQINKFLLSNSKSDAPNQDMLDLYSLLDQLKMQEHTDAIVKMYGVTGLSRLLELTEEHVNEWKTIPVGFRIKLRKIINQHHKSKEQQHQNNILASPSTEKEEEIDIQAIIKRRQTERVYEPIQGKQLDEEQEQAVELSKFEEINENQERQNTFEDEEDILISSLNMAFLEQRRPVENTVNTKIMIKSQENNQPANTKLYCWTCLKKLSKQAKLIEENRAFCSKMCSQGYHRMTEIPHNSLGSEQEQPIDLCLL